MITFVVLREIGIAFHSFCLQMKLMIRPWEENQSPQEGSRR